MKVIVQNGVQHALSRFDVEAMITEFPLNWKKYVKSILLCGEYTSEIRASFHKQNERLSIYSPLSAEAVPSKDEMIAELVLALAIVVEHGELPERVSASLRRRFLEQEQDVLENCFRKVANKAA